MFQDFIYHIGDLDFKRLLNSGRDRIQLSPRKESDNSCLTRRQFIYRNNWVEVAMTLTESTCDSFRDRCWNCCNRWSISFGGWTTSKATTVSLDECTTVHPTTRKLAFLFVRLWNWWLSYSCATKSWLHSINWFPNSWFMHLLLYRKAFQFYILCRAPNY